MNFSEIYACSGIAEFSPNSEYIGIVKGLNITVVQSSHLTVISSYKVLDQISKLCFSSDSSFIFAAQFKRGIVQIFGVLDKQWNAKLNLGMSGLAGCWWAPDSRQILTVSDLEVRLSVWSLVDRSVAHIPAPKHANKGLSFSNDGRFMALCERGARRDRLGVYQTDSWALISNFDIETFNAEDVKWTRDDSGIIIWDSDIQYRIYLYSPTGQLQARYSAYDNALGIRTVSLSPNGQLISIGSYDSSIRTINHLTFTKQSEMKHNILVDYEAQIYQEEEYTEPGYSSLTTRCKIYIDALMDPPVKVPALPTSVDRAKPLTSVTLNAWSSDSRYLATRVDSMPSAVWIWEAGVGQLSVLLMHYHSVKYAAWNPTRLFLAFCTGNNRVYFWSEEGASVCDICDTSFIAQKCVWSPNGQCLALFDKVTSRQSQLLIAYPQFESMSE